MADAENPRFHASTRLFRFGLLFFNCMLTFGSYFCFDMPSVLQDTFTGGQCNTTVANASAGFENMTCADCDGCLGMSDDDYNLLYAIYAWTNAVVVIGAGFLIDKLGNRIGLFMFSFLCVLGSSTFAAGALLKGTKYMLPVMLLGRLLFGSGNGSLTIEQNRITAYWFKNKELALAFGITLTFSRLSIVLNLLPNRITAYWFKNKELALAFGITLAFSRLGSVLNFFLTQNFASVYGLNWTLWGGAMLCGLGFISAIIVSSLDIIGVRQLGDTENLRTESKKVRVTDVRYFSMSYWLLALTIMFFYNGVFPFVADSRVTDVRYFSMSYWLLALTIMFFYNGVFPFVADSRVTDVRYFSMFYWLLALTIMFFYNGVFPFVADSSKFIHVKYGFTDQQSSYISGSVYDVSMVLSPFLGGVIDILGLRGYLAMGCALATIPVFGILAFSDVYPLVATLWLGITYSLAASSMWPSIPLVVSQATIGTAMGLTTSIQMIGIGIANVVVGQILGQSDYDDQSQYDEILRRWKFVMIFLLANTLACVTSSFFLNVTDRKRGGILNLSRKEKLKAQDLLSQSTSTIQEDDEREPLLHGRRSAIN